VTTHAPMKTMPEPKLRPAPVQDRSLLGAAWMTVTLTTLGIIGAIFTAWITVERSLTESGLFNETAFPVLVVIAAATAVFLVAAFVSSRRGRRI